MKYISIRDENDTFWIELDGEGTAYRQVILSDDRYHVSCMEDCLAEGRILTSELSGEINYISQDEFNRVWAESTHKQAQKWEKIKNKYAIGSLMVARLVYFYPQGPIFEKEGILINYKGKEQVELLSELVMTVIGYDDTNMWVIAK